MSEQIKELKSIMPELLISEPIFEPGKKKANHKLLFSTDTEYIFKVAAAIEIQRKCLKEYKQHICLKVYKNKWDHLLKFKNIEKMELNEIVEKLDEQYEKANTDKTAEGVSGELSK